MLAGKVNHHHSNTTQILFPLQKPFVSGGGGGIPLCFLQKPSVLRQKCKVFRARNNRRTINAVANSTSATTTTTVETVVTVQKTVGGFLSNLGLSRGLDDITDLLGKTLLVELVAAELGSIDSKRKPPKEIDVNLKHLKLIWSLHQSVAGEHIRAASYLLQYKTSSSSFVARPVLIDPEQIPTVPETNIPLADLMKKRKAPTLAIFDKPTSASDEAKRSKKDVPAEGIKNLDVQLPVAVSKKPPLAPSRTASSVPPSEVITSSPERTSSLMENPDATLKRLRKTSSITPIVDPPQPSNVGDGTQFLVPFSSAVSLVKSWSTPSIQSVGNTLSRDAVTSMAAQYAASLISCLNTIIDKDEAIKSSSSSNGVEKAFAGLSQSLTESRLQYEQDKETWEKKFKSMELERNNAVAASKELEKKINASKVLEKELITSKQNNQELDTKLKSAEQKKIELEKKLTDAEELLKKRITSEKMKRKAAVKRSFAAGWDKGWNKGLAVMTSQAEYASVKFFRDGWVAALTKMGVAETSELFQEHIHGPPPSPGEEEEDEAPSDASSMRSGDQASSRPVDQPSEQLQQTNIPDEQHPLPSSSSQPSVDVLGSKEKFMGRMELLSAHDTELMKKCNAYFKAGHTELSKAEILDILGADSSEQAVEAYQYLKCLLDRAVANNVAYYEMIEDLQDIIEDLRQQPNELHKQYEQSSLLLHQAYEEKYKKLSADKGYDRFVSSFEKREMMLKKEVLEHRNIAKLLEEENNALQLEIKQLKSSTASSSRALIPVTDEGFSFLEVENANLREEVEALKKSGSTSARGRTRVARGRARAGRLSIEDARTQSTLENQAIQLSAKNEALADMSKKVQTLDEQLSAQNSALETKTNLVKNLQEQLDRLTYQFHKQPREFWMAGYNEALVHLDDRLQQSNSEGYKQGWLNALCVLKLEQGHYLWDYHNPGVLDLPVPPFKLDMSWIPARAIPHCLISKYLGDYNLHSNFEIARPEHLLDQPSVMNVRMLRDLNFINSPYALEEPPAGEEPVSRAEEKRAIE